MTHKSIGKKRGEWRVGVKNGTHKKFQFKDTMCFLLNVRRANVKQQFFC